MAKTAAQQQLLLVAARNGDREATLRLLVEDGVYINCKDTLGFTPLMWAVYYNHFAVTELLLSYVANLNAKSLGGHTPLHIAVSKGSVECLNLLCKAGANMNVRSKNGYTALHEACSSGHWECAKILLEHKISVNIKSNEGFTPLHFAASKGYTDICKLLLEQGAAIDFTDTSGRTPLHVAATCPNGKDVVDLLIKKGANVVKKCLRHRTPLQHAIEQNCTISIPTLKQAEARNRASEATSEAVEKVGERKSVQLPKQDNGAPTKSGETHTGDPPNSENGSAKANSETKNAKVIVNGKTDAEVEAIVKARVEDVRGPLEAKLAQKNKVIEQLLAEKDKYEIQLKQQQLISSQEQASLQDQLRIYQKQLEIARTEKASMQLDLEMMHKKLALISTELQQQLTKQKVLHEQVVQLEESRVCKICFERTVDTILFPCSHFCLCHDCTIAVVKKNKKCPICRSTIERSSLCYFT